MFSLKRMIMQHRSKKLLKKLKFLGKGCYISLDLRLAHPELVSIDDYVQIGQNTWIHGHGGVEFGAGTILGPNITIYTMNHRYENQEFLPFNDEIICKKVSIGKSVWIGGNVVILPGANIGDGAVIGAGSVVSGVIPSCAVAFGNPAVTFKYRNIDVFSRLLEDGKFYLKSFPFDV